MAASAALHAQGATGHPLWIDAAPRGTFIVLPCHGPPCAANQLCRPLIVR